MKKNAICFLLALLPAALFSQDIKPPRLVKTAISTSGCSAYLPANMPAFDLSHSEDNAEMYTASVDIDSFSFACIAVKFAEPFASEEGDAMEELLISYLDYLKGAFGITSSAGYGRGHTLEGFPGARGVLDYWEDADNNQVVVKGWINASHLGVLYIAGPREYPVFNVQQMYLNGWRFD